MCTMPELDMGWVSVGSSGISAMRGWRTAQRPDGNYTPRVGKYRSAVYFHAFIVYLLDERLLAESLAGRDTMPRIRGAIHSLHP